MKGAKVIDKQLSHTELREQRRLRREALSTPAIEIIKQTISSDASQSLWHASCSKPSNSSKTASEILPDLHHSRESGSSGSVKRAIPILDVGNGELSESKSRSSLPLHQTRLTNVSDTQREKETQINFPPPHDPVWKEVNEELKVALPQALSWQRLKNLTTGKISSKLTQWLHSFVSKSLEPNLKIRNTPLPIPNLQRKTKGLKTKERKRKPADLLTNR